MNIIKHEEFFYNNFNDLFDFFYDLFSVVIYLKICNTIFFDSCDRYILDENIFHRRTTNNRNYNLRGFR